MCRLQRRLWMMLLVIGVVSLCAEVGRPQGGDEERFRAAFANAVRLAAQGNYTEAIRQYEILLAQAPALFGADSTNTAAVQSNLATLYDNVGQYARAEQLHRRSLEIREAKLGQNHAVVAASLTSLGLHYRTTGQHARAEPLLVRSLQIREAQPRPNQLDIAAALNNLAVLYHDTGEYARAEPLYLRSIRIKEALLGRDHQAVASSLGNLADLCKATGQYTRADQNYQRSLEIKEAVLGKDHPSVAATLNNLADLNKLRGEYTKAESQYHRSLEIAEARLGKDHPQFADTLNNEAGLFAAQERWSKAASGFDAARRILHDHVVTVLPTFSEPEQLAFLRAAREPLHEALSLGLQRADDPGSVTLSATWALNAKGLAQQALAERSLLARDSADPKLAAIVAELLDVRRRLANLTLNAPRPGEEQRQRQERAGLIERERALGKRLGQADASARPAPWRETDEVRRLLPADTVLIEIVRLEVADFKATAESSRWKPARYVAWIIPRAGKEVIQLVDLGEAVRIEKAVKAMRDALQQAPKAINDKGEPDAEKELLESLKPLSKLVLEPLTKYAGDRKRWIISPDADLWLVPWAALLLKDGRYAVEQHEISHVLSGRELLQPVSKVKAGKPLVFADPDYDLGAGKAAAGGAALLKLPQVRRLPGTETEARAVTPALGRFAGVEPVVHLRKEAREDTVKLAKGPKVLLLSTHGFFLEDQRTDPAKSRVGHVENPLLRCGLLLAGANNRDAAGRDADDGVLTGLEVVGLDLRGTDLVVLSACETGLGQVHNGEGVAGLRQSFQLAGARSVVSTLWQVPDLESARLVTSFFENLAAGKSKAESLRQAHLALIKGRRDRDAAAHPFFWAAFTLTGQGP